MGNCNSSTKVIDATTGDSIQANHDPHTERGGHQRVQSSDDTITYASIDTHLYPNESMDYDDIRVIFYEVSGARYKMRQLLILTFGPCTSIPELHLFQ